MRGGEGGRGNMCVCVIGKKVDKTKTTAAYSVSLSC